MEYACEGSPDRSPLLLRAKDSLSAEEIATAQDVVGLAILVAGGRGGGRSRGLGGNPFKGKTPQEIQGMFEAKGFEPRGPDPLSGEGGYVNPQSGRSYQIDPGRTYKKTGVEPPHVDVNRVKGDLPKKKLEL